jgi:hypothetical protein
MKKVLQLGKRKQQRANEVKIMLLLGGSTAWG